jgi:CBS domain-containing protein
MTPTIPRTTAVTTSGERVTAVEWAPAMQELTAGDVMNPDVVAVRPDTPLREIVDRLVARRISAAPVVDGDGTVVGMVSETDLIDEEKRRVRLPRTLLFGVFPILEEAVSGAYDEGASLTARELMTGRVFTVTEATPARTVADEMVTRKINHVPVLREGQLVGIIARMDILRAVQAQWKKSASKIAPE